MSYYETFSECSGTASYTPGPPNNTPDMTNNISAAYWRKYCWIIPAADLVVMGTKRTMTDISLWFGTGLGASFNTTFEIYLSNTTFTDVSSGGNDTNTLIKIYDGGGIPASSGPLKYSGGPGTGAFTWDGTSNVLVTIFTKGTLALGAASGFVSTSVTTGYSWGMYQNNSSAAAARVDITGFSMTGTDQIWEDISMSC